MIEEYPKKFNQNLVKESESLKGVRGGKSDSNKHPFDTFAVISPSVIMGSPGETYTIKHGTIDRKAYMLVSYKSYKKLEYKSLVCGLEKLIF